jgi:hypothetical protein
MIQRYVCVFILFLSPMCDWILHLFYVV